MGRSVPLFLDGRHSVAVAVVILHVHKYEKKVTKKFKSGGLHEKHVVATWKLLNHLSIRL